MSLLTGRRATFRGVCHNDSEVEGGAAEEGLANDTERIAQGVYVRDIAAEMGVHPRTVSRALRSGGAPPGQRPVSCDAPGRFA